MVHKITVITEKINQSAAVIVKFPKINSSSYN